MKLLLGTVDKKKKKKSQHTPAKMTGFCNVKKLHKNKYQMSFQNIFHRQHEITTY